MLPTLAAFFDVANLLPVSFDVFFAFRYPLSALSDVFCFAIGFCLCIVNGPIPLISDSRFAIAIFLVFEEPCGLFSFLFDVFAQAFDVFLEGGDVSAMGLDLSSLPIDAAEVMVY